MQFYTQDELPAIRYLYYVITDQELEYIANHQYKLFPVRFFTKTYFCPLLSREYAYRIASERANWRSDAHHTHVMRFLVCAQDLLAYIKGSLDNERAMIVVQKKELQHFNSQIIGYIERIGGFDLSCLTN